MVSNEQYRQIFNAVRNDDFRQLKLLFSFVPIQRFDFNRAYRCGDERCFLLKEAVLRGNTDIVDFLIKHGADYRKCDDDGKSPIIWAAKIGQTQLVQYFMKLGADKETADKDGKTLLYHAAAGGHIALIQYLLQVGADIHTQKSVDTLTPLMIAAQNGKTKAVSCLLDNGADINQKNNQGMTALMLTAVAGSRIETVKLLIRRRADIYLRNNNGETAMELAYMNQNCRTGSILDTAEKNPERCKPTLEESIASMSEKQIEQIGSSCDLIGLIQWKNAYISIMEYLPYKKKKAFYKAIGHCVHSSIEQQMKNIIRNERERHK